MLTAAGVIYDGYEVVVRHAPFPQCAWEAQPAVYALAAALRALPASLAELYDGVRRRIGPLRVDRVLPSSRARASSEEPQKLLRRSPGRDDARSGGRARAIGWRALGTPEHGAYGRWKRMQCLQPARAPV